MPRALFEKKGNAVWMSHLDLMRVFQRAFKRAGLPLTHTQGYSPRPTLSIALPLSVGVESSCELLDFQLEGETVADDEICTRLNGALVDGVRVLAVYSDFRTLKHLTHAACTVTLEYDSPLPPDASAQICALFDAQSLTVEKHSKNGVREQDIIPMIRTLTAEQSDAHTIVLHAVICCQNPALNPAQLAAAVARYLPQLAPDFSKCARVELYDNDGTIFR